MPSHRTNNFHTSQKLSRVISTHIEKTRVQPPPALQPAPTPPIIARLETDDLGASMKIHEYQARQILQAAGLPVPPSKSSTGPTQAAAAHAKLGGGNVVVKAQVHAGGRGKAGFVMLVRQAAPRSSKHAKLHADRTDGLQADRPRGREGQQGPASPRPSISPRNITSASSSTGRRAAPS